VPSYKKRFGQHHLVHSGLCRPLIEFLEPAARRVLEIGPGGGALTRALLEAGASLLALEVDPTWAFALRQRTAGLGVEPRLAIAVADALEIDWERLPAGCLVAGNLPYNVATPLLRSILSVSPVGLRAGFLVQWEVGRRLTAAPGGKEYGALSVLVAARAGVEELGRVEASSFRPRPKVDGLFVGLTVRHPPVAEAEMGDFNGLVQAAFAQRRKTLRNALGAAWGRGAALAALEEAGIDPGERAERLSLADFTRLHHAALAAKSA
jgi:16S rRNA (adenine1518-N6/adenine1519-N6)-dimethyltransferase